MTKEIKGSVAGSKEAVKTKRNHGLIDRLVARFRMVLIDLAAVLLSFGAADQEIDARLRMQAAGPALRRAAALYRLNRRRAAP